jgi:hypothetical protein
LEWVCYTGKLVRLARGTLTLDKTKETCYYKQTGENEMTELWNMEVEDDGYDGDWTKEEDEAETHDKALDNCVFLDDDDDWGEDDDLDEIE